MNIKIEFPVKDTFYKLNSENKIELHIPDKNAYKNLTDEIKKDIKSGFIWGRMRNAWVSRSKGGRIPWTMQKYNISYQGADDLKSFEDSEEQKASRLGAKADRYRTYAKNAEQRAKNLQADFNRLRKDWSWLTQPNVNTSGGRAFANSRNRVMARYDRGMEEYQKAGNMAEYAKQLDISSSQSELNDLGYLSNRIKENTKIVKGFPKFDEYYTDQMKAESLTDETIMYLDGQMNRYKMAFDKLEYYQHFYNILAEKKKEAGTFYDEAAAKKTIKKDFKEFLKEHYNIKLLKMSIAFAAKRGTFYYYKTDKTLPVEFHSGWAADHAAQKSVKELYILMQKLKKKFQESKKVVTEQNLFS